MDAKRILLKELERAEFFLIKNDRKYDKNEVVNRESSNKR